MDTQTPQLPKKLLPFVWHFLKPYWKELLVFQIFCFAWSLDHTLWPYIIMVFIDTISNYVGDRSDAWSALSTPIFMGLGLWILLEVWFRLGGILFARFVPKIEADIRMSMFNYVQHHSHHYFSSKMAGSIANKISDMPQSITRAFQMITQLFLPVILAMIIAIVFFSRISGFFALILAVWVLLHIAICIAFAGKCDSLSNIHSEARTNLTGKIVDSLTNNANVRLFSRHNYEKAYLYFFQKDERKKHWQSLWYIEKMKFVLGLFTFLGPGLALNGYMIYSWQQGQLTTGEVVFIFNTAWNITMMAWLAGLELPQLFKEIGICRQALTIIQDPHDIIDNKTAKPLKINKGEIKFENVTFNYHSSNNLFQNKNLIIHPGEKVGLVGFSGSGKTTFVNLILRYFDIEAGKILIDGQDIRNITQNSLRENISVIPQDPTLFHRTVMENIRYGDLEATDEEVIEASIKANCHDFIEKMPEKYSTMVGERGTKLSGGQRQRIAIARAILKNAPILILDEATSALDSMTEKKIQDSLHAVMNEQTTIVIAHRLSTLSGMDRILVFKEGKIVEEGTHNELININGHYAKMWNMQAGGFLPDEDSTYE